MNLQKSKLLFEMFGLVFFPLIFWNPPHTDVLSVGSFTEISILP